MFHNISNYAIGDKLLYTQWLTRLWVYLLVLYPLLDRCSFVGHPVGGHHRVLEQLCVCFRVMPGVQLVYGYSSMRVYKYVKMYAQMHVCADYVWYV